MAGNPQGGNVNNAMQSDGAGGYSITPQEPSFGGNSNPLGMGMQPTGNARPPGAPQAPVYNNPAPPMAPTSAPTMLPDRGPRGPGGYARPGFGQSDYSAMPPDQRPDQRGFGGFPGFFGGFEGYDPFAGFGGGAGDAPTRSQQGGVFKYDPNGARRGQGGLDTINPYKRPQD